MFKHNVLTRDEIIYQSDRKFIGKTSRDICHNKECDLSYFLGSDKDIYRAFFLKMNTMYLIIQNKKKGYKERNRAALM